MKTEAIEEARLKRGCGVSVKSAVLAVICFYLAALLLNASALHRQASLMEFGRMRSICMGAITPAQWLSSHLYLNRLRSSLEEITKEED